MGNVPLVVAIERDVDHVDLLAESLNHGGNSFHVLFGTRDAEFSVVFDLLLGFWNAVAESPINPEEKVKVSAVLDGLMLKVEPLKNSD